MDSEILDHWYPIAMAKSITVQQETLLLGQTINIKNTNGNTNVFSASNKHLPSINKYGHIWTTLGDPKQDLFKIPEADEQGRILVDCGSIRVKCSPLRAVENFLDIAHFPFVHTDILGAEPHTEVDRYEVEINETDNEIWAKKIRFFQPQAAKSAEEGITTDYMYRVAAPTSAVLYKTCPPKPEAWDVITLFVQPVTETSCLVWPWMALYDDNSSHTDLVNFQQMIFMQDRSILENQIPTKLPLDPGMEIPTQADKSSIAYRRWLKKINYTYGAEMVAV